MSDFLLLRTRLWIADVESPLDVQRCEKRGVVGDIGNIRICATLKQVHRRIEAAIGRSDQQSGGVVTAYLIDLRSRVKQSTDGCKATLPCGVVQCGPTTHYRGGGRWFIRVSLWITPK